MADPTQLSGDVKDFATLHQVEIECNRCSYEWTGPSFLPARGKIKRTCDRCLDTEERDQKLDFLDGQINELKAQLSKATRTKVQVAISWAMIGHMEQRRDLTPDIGIRARIQRRIERLR